ncbi:MAG: hypothetical protein CMF23_17265 [Ignavibacteriae bacterium]|nr:hypothetical protein [Ignavibacteriota bacterium]
MKRIILFLILLLGIESCQDRVTSPTVDITPDIIPNINIAPILLAPIEGEYVENKIKFRWAKILNVKKYEFMISSDSSFTSNIIDEITADTCYQVDGKQIIKSANMFWRVRAIKTDGNPGEWSESGKFSSAITFRNTFNDIEINYVEETSDSGFVVATDNGLLRLNRFGELIWRKGYSINTVSVKETKDGDFVAVGRVAFRLRIYKTNENGDVMWNKDYFHNVSGITSVDLTAEGDILCAGATWLFLNDGRDIHTTPWIIKLGENGDSLLTNYMESGRYNMITSIHYRTDGTVVLSGTSTEGVFPIAYASKISETGEPLWTTFSDIGSPSLSSSLSENENIVWSYYRDDNYIAILDSEGNYFNSFYVNDYNDHQAIDNNELVVCSNQALFKLNSNGNEIWYRDEIIGKKIIICKDDGFLIFNKDTFIKTDYEGYFNQ